MRKGAKPMMTINTAYGGPMAPCYVPVVLPVEPHVYAHDAAEYSAENGHGLYAKLAATTMGCVLPTSDTLRQSDGYGQGYNGARAEYASHKGCILPTPESQRSVCPPADHACYSIHLCYWVEPTPLCCINGDCDPENDVYKRLVMFGMSNKSAI